MSDVFQIASIGLQQSKERLDAISLNAASASLTGYRRHVVTGRAFTTELTAADAPVQSDPSVAATSMDLNGRLLQQVDLRRGGIVATGRALDVAIETDDLFFALTDGTQTWLTRAGSFRVDDAGLLVGERGLRVVGAQGEMRLPGSGVEVAADGRISHQGVVVGALLLFRPNDRASLQAAEGSLLLAPGGAQPAEASAQRVRSGALEASNTDASREMLGLVALSRQFESLSRVVQGYDELLGRTIQKLGEM